jgi:pimeloyl-ACP methyl ester carboxylesterase
LLSLKPSSQRQPDHEAGEMHHSDRGLLLRKPPAYQDRWWSTDDGLRLYARDYPASSGRVRLPVICLHGLTRNSADFEDVAPYIAALDRRVIVPDIRGRGLSEKDQDPMNYHIWTYARDILDLCDSMGIGQAIFVGTSMGGLITMVLSTLRPNLIKAAVLNDVGPVLSSKGLARISSYAAQSQQVFKNWHDAAVYIAEANRIAFPNYSPSDWQKFAKRVFIKGRDGLLRLAYDPRITEAFKSVTVTSSTYDMAPCYVSLATGRRVLLVRGALSDLLEETEADQMALLSTDFKRVDVDYVGHAPMLTEPTARAAITDFLESQG